MISRLMSAARDELPSWDVATPPVTTPCTVAPPLSQVALARLGRKLEMAQRAATLFRRLEEYASLRRGHSRAGSSHTQAPTMRATESSSATGSDPSCSEHQRSDYHGVYGFHGEPGG